jgi:transcriptional regulator with XRE-family HTH domain
MAFSASWMQKQLAMRLADERAKSGMSAREVAESQGWSHTKITRIENLSIKITPRDTAKLAAFYNLPQEEVERLCDMARAARTDIWWHRYEQWLTPAHANFIGYENDASTAWSLGPLLIPGLLQTREYITNLYAAGQIILDPDRAEALLAVRMLRQQRLTEPTPLTFTAILGEAALRANHGNPDVLAAQLTHLRRVAELPNVTLRVVPFGAAVALGGPLDLLQFTESGPSIAFSETPLYSIVHDDPLEIRQARRTIDQTASAALSEADSIAFIEQIQEGMTWK